MEPNELGIRRVFVRPQGQLEMDETLRVGVINEIVVEWEAGATANARNIPPPGPDDILFQISVWDHTAGAPAVPPFAPPAVVPDGANRHGIYELIQNVPAATFTAGNFYEITTSLYRAPNTVSFCEGPLFYVTV